MVQGPKAFHFFAKNFRHEYNLSMWAQAAVRWLNLFSGWKNEFRPLIITSNCWVRYTSKIQTNI